MSVLTAAYDTSSHELTSLVNATKQSSSVDTGGFDGKTGDQTVTDAAGDATEDIYDQFGDVVRKIETLRNGSTVTGYLVTVSSYSYWGSQDLSQSNNADYAEAGVDLLNAPTGEVTYAPFQINGTDAAGQRYSLQPSTPPQQIVTYYQWNGDPDSLQNHPEYGKVETEMTLAGPGSTYGDWNYNVTNYSGYSLTTFGKPATTVQQVKEYSVDTSGNPTFVSIVGPSTSTANTYDDAGNLLSANDSTGVVTSYTYTNKSTGVPNGLLLDTYRSSSIATGGNLLVSSNSYYSSTNASSGAVARLLSSSTTYNYENQSGSLVTVSVAVRNLSGSALTTPLVTNYTYDAVGNKLTETLPDGELTKFGYDDLNRLVSMNESQGSTTLFSERFILNDDGTRASASESQLQSDNSTTATLNYTWSYDNDQRLLSESLSSSNTAINYSDTYGFDLNGNIITNVHTGAGGTVGTTTDTYNGDDQLISLNAAR